MLVVRACGLRKNFYVYSLYRNPDQDDRIYDYLLISMAAVQAEDVRASFVFVGDLNAIITSGWVLQRIIVMVLQPLN